MRAPPRLDLGFRAPSERQQKHFKVGKGTCLRSKGTVATGFTSCFCLFEVVAMLLPEGTVNTITKAAMIGKAAATTTHQHGHPGPLAECASTSHSVENLSPSGVAG